MKFLEFESWSEMMIWFDMNLLQLISWRILYSGIEKKESLPANPSVIVAKEIQRADWLKWSYDEKLIRTKLAIHLKSERNPQPLQ